jgi:hypothetical protein
VVVEVPDLNQGTTAFDVIVISVESLPKGAAGVGEHGGLS